MIIKPKSLEEIKNEFLTTVLNCTNKVTKILPTSVLNSIAYGIAKIAQKMNKEAAMIESSLFPEYAIGSVLDDVAKREGIPERLGETYSSVNTLWVVNLNAGNVIIKAGSKISGYNNIPFTTTVDLIILASDGSGMGYVEAVCDNVGNNGNVGAYSLNKIVSLASGSSALNKIFSVTNPSNAVGGEDLENDYDFRKRILNYNSISGINTIDYYENIIRHLLPEVLRIKTNPINALKGNFKIVLVSRSSGNFSGGDLSTLKTNLIPFLPLRDANILSLNIENISWTYFDIILRFKKDAAYTLLNIAQRINLSVNNYINHKEWEFGKKVDFEIMFSIARQTDGVLDVNDNAFRPNADIVVPINSLPKLRNIILVDELTGEVLDKQFPVRRNYGSSGSLEQVLEQIQNL